MYEPRTGRFDVVFELAGSGIVAAQPALHRHASIETVEAAVLTRAAQARRSRQGADVTVERRPKAEFGRRYRIAADQVVGLAARRALRAGQALRPAT